MYHDNKLLQAMYNEFSQPFWHRGNLPPSNQDGTAFVDPWTQTGNPATPFDQNFYLILNVAVGGTNGWFRDGLTGKPRVDASPARKDFWRARDKWYPSWEDLSMQVKGVKIWQQKGLQRLPVFHREEICMGRPFHSFRKVSFPHRP
jgi:hypothetical protein